MKNLWQAGISGIPREATRAEAERAAAPFGFTIEEDEGYGVYLIAVPAAMNEYLEAGNELACVVYVDDLEVQITVEQP